MSLSRREFFRYAGASAAGAAVGAKAFDLAPVEAAVTSLKIKEAKAFPSVCPYCAVGCAQLIYVRDNKIIDIEGHPDTPHTLGRLCPKGAATIQLSNNPLRPIKALYRAPGSDKWEEKPLEWMYDEIAKRVKATRDATARGSPTSAQPASTTRSATSSQNSTARSASFTTSIRLGSDTPPRSQLWGPRSGGGR